MASIFDVSKYILAHFDQLFTHMDPTILVASHVSVYMSHPLSSLVEPTYTVIPMLT